MSSNRAFQHFTKKSPNLNFKDHLNIGKTSAQFEFSCWRWKAIFVDLKIAQWGSELWRVRLTADRLTTLVTLRQERWLIKVDKEDNISFWSQYAKHSPRERDWWTINSSKEKTIGCREHLETAIDVEMARGEVFLKTCVTVAEMKDLLNQLEDCKE